MRNSLTPSHASKRQQRRKLEGLALRREDLSGSVSSAFYQGNIVSAAIISDSTKYESVSYTTRHRRNDRRTQTPSTHHSFNEYLDSANNHAQRRSNETIGNQTENDLIHIESEKILEAPGHIMSTLESSHHRDSLRYSKVSFRDSFSLFGDGIFSEEDLEQHLERTAPHLSTTDRSSIPASSLYFMQRDSNLQNRYQKYGANCQTQNHSDQNCFPEEVERGSSTPVSFSDQLFSFVDPYDWLCTGMTVGKDGTPYFDANLKWSLSGIFRTLLYNPIYPEFTSLQQFNWAIIIGMSMGVYTTVWKFLIQTSVLFVWKDIPIFLLRFGVFTDLNGSFPIYHHMWIVPGVFSAIISYAFASLPTQIPDQNKWIHNLHSRGVQSAETFGYLFVLSTAGMASGLSLGPELPLILTAGMIGSWIGVLCDQSKLQARVLNLTAASAAISSYFGFPMAGALYVLEIPHRMGLQYFEAVSPATIASIVAVLTNRLLTGNDATGYYVYPFLNESLPSELFMRAIVYGLFGGAVGMFYVKVVLYLKHYDFFFDNCNGNVQQGPRVSRFKGGNIVGEGTGLLQSVGDISNQRQESAKKLPPLTNHFRREPNRAATLGALTGVLVGIVCMFIPHVMFWGEDQLQTLIDNGRTPLPIFGHGNETSADILALSYCVVRNDTSTQDHFESQSALGCSFAIALAKIFVTGLSLGTGIVGGHFWGPLFVGCAASHFLTGLVHQASNYFGILTNLSSYPHIALICVMGSTHVVTYRAHIAIILILTLTIDNSTTASVQAASQYSAVLPLLTVSIFVAYQISCRVIFYEKQRSRGDIMAVPEVLCKAGKGGRPIVVDYEGHLGELDEERYSFESETETDVGAQYERSGSPYQNEIVLERRIGANEIFQRLSPLPSDTSSTSTTGIVQPTLETNSTNNKTRRNLRMLDDMLNA